MSERASLAAPPLPSTRAERLSAVLCAVRTLRPRPSTPRVTEDRIALHTLLCDAVAVAVTLSGETFASPLRGVPQDLAAAHAMWAPLVGEVQVELNATRDALAAAGRAVVAGHAELTARAWRDAAWRVTRLFEDLTERRV